MVQLYRPFLLLFKKNIQQVRKFSVSTSRCKIPNNLDTQIINHYLKLPLPKNTVIANYVWIDGTDEYVRAKNRTLDFKPKSVKDLPEWQFDGSSTYQAKGENSDIYLIPVRMYKDPFLGGDHILVLCETYDYKRRPTKSNHRKECAEAMKCIEKCEPMWGIEQEFTLLGFDGRPFNWPKNGFPGPQGPYYCGVGADRVYGRAILDCTYLACLYAGIDLGGTNVEVMPAQLEYQIGPSYGMKCADDLWMSRYILNKIAEEYGVVVTLDPKPMEGNWNGTGAHTNFSTIQMREDGGMEFIKKAIKRLEKKHEDHIKVYDPKGGEDNKRRLSGRHETSSIHEFSSAVASRGVSIRIPRQVGEAGKGYLEDRRPSANMDPYSVCNAIVRTIFLDD